MNKETAYVHLQHPDARIGDLVLHSNGSVGWREAPGGGQGHHVSWIDDECKRVIPTTGSIKLLSEFELKDLATLIARYDEPFGITNKPQPGKKVEDFHIGPAAAATWAPKSDSRQPTAGSREPVADSRQPTADRGAK